MTILRKNKPINFWKVDKFSLPYFLLYVYVRFVFRHIYYKKYIVLNPENLPKAGEPTMIIANHQNGLNDALALLFMFADFRQPVCIARGDLFRKTFVAKLLRFIKIIPAMRSMDGYDPRANDETFNVAAQVLRHGNTLIMFPEAGHDEGHYISYFRKGFARIAFKAEELNGFNLNMKIVPVALHYSGYVNMREKLAIVVGKPTTLEEYFPIYKENPKKAMLHLARDMEDEVKNMMLNINHESVEEYSAQNFLRLIYERRLMRRKGWDDRYFQNSLRAGKLIVKRLEELRATRNEKRKRLLANAQEMMQDIGRMRLRAWLFERQPKYWGLLLRSIVWVLLFPIYLAAYLLNVLPFSAPNLINRNVKDVMLHSSFAFGLSSLITFPITYFIYAMIVEIYTHSLLKTLLFLCLMPVTLLFFWTYRKSIIKLRGEWRYYFLSKTKHKDLLHTQELYRKTMQDMEQNVL
jgi:1-acyl-sn-glycerol-3-phosphate acyltransferase